MGRAISLPITKKTRIMSNLIPCPINEKDLCSDVLFDCLFDNDIYCEGDRNTKNWKARAESIMEAEAEDIGRWMWGDIYGFKLEKKDYYEKVYPDEERDSEEGFDWVDVGSCWGYYCDPDELIEEVIQEHGLRPSSAA